MRYFNTVKIDPKVYENIKKFIQGQDGENDLFNLINASKLNDYLKSLMSGLSAKVFRTYNASITLQNELNKCNLNINDSNDKKISFYNLANREVAVLCNHQKAVSKNYNVQAEKMQLQLKEQLQYLSELKDHLETFKIDKKSKKNQKAEKLEKEKK